jgi:hypothetical protein
MIYHPVFRPGAQRHLKKIGEADLVIGLPTYHNPDSAAHVTRVLLTGINQHYPSLKTVLLNADIGEKATTRQAIAAQLSANGRACDLVTGRYQGLSGQGSAIAALLDAALALDAKAIIILDSYTQTITPNWIPGLAHLILEDKTDLVLPRYQWSLQAPGSTVSDLIVYPLFRALWGKSARHPAAADFALSPKIATAVLDEDVWETDVATYGLPPWLTTYAVIHKWRVAQSALGKKQTSLDFPVETAQTPSQKRYVRRLSKEIKAQFQDVVSVLLRQVYHYRSYWQDTKSFHSLSTLTQFAGEVPAEPIPEHDPVPLLDSLALGWMEYRSLWRNILTPDNLAHLEALASLPPDRFYFPSDLWARIIYDFAVVFNKGEYDPYQIVQSLYPLFQGRLAAYWQEIAGLSLIAHEGTISAQAVEFEETRPYLKNRWQEYPPWQTRDPFK